MLQSKHQLQHRDKFEHSILQHSDEKGNGQITSSYHQQLLVGRHCHEGRATKKTPYRLAYSDSLISPRLAPSTRYLYSDRQSMVLVQRDRKYVYDIVSNAAAAEDIDNLLHRCAAFPYRLDSPTTCDNIP